MKLEDCRNKYYESTGMLSDNSRKLAFAGIAIIWVFKQKSGDVYMVPNLLKTAMFWFVLSLLLDLTQYVYQTIVWKRFHDHKETELDHDEDADFLAPTKYTEVPQKILWSKVCTLIVGYIFILLFFI